MMPRWILLQAGSRLHSRKLVSTGSGPRVALIVVRPFVAVWLQQARADAPAVNGLEGEGFEEEEIGFPGLDRWVEGARLACGCVLCRRLPVQW